MFRQRHPFSPHVLAELWVLQGPNAESRRQVESLQPATADGPMRLDPGDAHEALLLADALQLDEIAALGCLQTAHDEVRRLRCSLPRPRPVAGLTAL